MKRRVCGRVHGHQLFRDILCVDRGDSVGGFWTPQPIFIALVSDGEWLVVVACLWDEEEDKSMRP